MKKIKLSDFTVTPLEETAKHENISDNEYFGSYSDYVSASKLHRISPRRGGSMTQYYHPTPMGWKESLICGSAVHECFLQSDEFQLISEPAGKPSAKLGGAIDAIRKYRRQGCSIEDAITKACDEVEYYMGNNTIRYKKILTKDNLRYYIKSLSFTENLVVPSDKMYPTVKGCIDSMKRNPVIMKQFKPTDVFGDPVLTACEDTLYLDFKVTYKDREHIVHFRGKLDHYSVNTEDKVLVLNDVKTSSDPLVPDWMEPTQHGGKLCYSMQFALYMVALKALAKKEWGYDDTWKDRTHVWAVQTRDSYNSRCYKVTDEMMEDGKSIYEDCLKMIAYYEMFGTPEHLPEEEVEFVD